MAKERKKKMTSKSKKRPSSNKTNKIKNVLSEEMMNQSFSPATLEIYTLVGQKRNGFNFDVEK